MLIIKLLRLPSKVRRGFRLSEYRRCFVSIFTLLDEKSTYIVMDAFHIMKSQDITVAFVTLQQPSATIRQKTLLLLHFGMKTIFAKPDT